MFPATPHFVSFFHACPTIQKIPPFAEHTCKRIGLHYTGSRAHMHATPKHLQVYTYTRQKRITVTIAICIVYSSYIRTLVHFI